MMPGDNDNPLGGCRGLMMASFVMLALFVGLLLFFG
jgi:hypothetical protein